MTNVRLQTVPGRRRRGGPKHPPKHRGLRNGFDEAAAPNQAPKQRRFGNTFEAPAPKQAPNSHANSKQCACACARFILHNSFEAAAPKHRRFGNALEVPAPKQAPKHLR